MCGVHSQKIFIELMRQSQESISFKLVSRLLHALQPPTNTHTHILSWSLLCHKMCSRQPSANAYS